MVCEMYYRYCIAVRLCFVLKYSSKFCRNFIVLSIFFVLNTIVFLLHTNFLELSKIMSSVFIQVPF